MRRSFWIVLGGVLVVVACGGSNEYPSGSSSGSKGSPPSPPGTVKTPPPGYYPTDRASLRTCVGSSLLACGSNSCCAPGYLCLFDRCVAPGLPCETDVDCTDDRYCEPTFSRCLARPTVCPLGDESFDGTCLERGCAAEQSSLQITRTVRSPCDCGSVPSSLPALGVSVQNRGRKTVPRGVKVRFWSRDGDDAGENVVTGETLEPLVPGQSTDVYVSLQTCNWHMTIVRDSDDCHVDAEPTAAGTHCGTDQE